MSANICSYMKSSNKELCLQFIDLCILLGCDYCESIRGIGPKRAMDLIKQYKNIDEILKHIDTKVSYKYNLMPLILLLLEQKPLFC